MRLIYLFILTAGLSFGTNFNFVQLASGTGSAVFGSGNTAGGMIIATVIEGTGPVTDTQGNTYTLIVTGAGGNIKYYAALNIAAGSNTVSPASGDIMAVEYSSALTTYFVCPGHISLTSSSGESGTISNQSVNGTGSNFNSATEVRAVFTGWENGTAHSCLIASGTIRHNGITPPAANDGYCLGDDSVGSMTGVYANNPFNISPGFFPSASTTVFLSLSNGGPGCVATSLPAPPSTFAIIY